ncbi:NAD-dependent epimerase/dehydratase family protein [Chloroflexota bacterium]
MLEEPILITGAHGMLGSALNRSLIAAGYKHSFIPSHKELDLEDYESVLEYFRKYQPKTIFHLASKVFGLQGNADNQLDLFRSNTRINLNLIDACRDIQVDKIIAAGSVAAYSYPFKKLPLNEEDFWGGEPHIGEYAYSYSKRYLLVHLNLLKATHGTDFAFCLLTNLYGPNDKFNPISGHVIPSLLYKAIVASENRKPLYIWGDGEQVRDFMYMDDAARAMTIISEKYSGIINIGTNTGIALREVADTLKYALGYPLKIVWQPEMPVGIPIRVVNNTRLIRLGFTPTITLEEGIKKTLEWVINNRGILRGF